MCNGEVGDQVIAATELELIGTGAAGEGVVAIAAEQGVTGAPDILDGPVGFGNAMCLNGMAKEQPDWTKAAETLGSDYLIKQTTTKNHAACGHVHAAVDGVLLIARENGLTPTDVKEIRVGSYQKAEELCGNIEPKTAFEAKFSLVYCCSAAMLWGSVRMAAFSPERLADVENREFMKRVSLVTDPECQSNFPALRSAKVEIETTDGRVLKHYATTRRGDPDAPLSDAELAAQLALPGGEREYRARPEARTSARPPRPRRAPGRRRSRRTSPRTRHFRSPGARPRRR